MTKLVAARENRVAKIYIVMAPGTSKSDVLKQSQCQEMRKEEG